jgi:protein-arginine kinase
MLFDELLKQTGEWLRGTGPDAEIVICCRLRLARNVQGFRFISRMDALTSPLTSPCKRRGMFCA